MKLFGRLCLLVMGVVALLPGSTSVASQLLGSRQGGMTLYDINTSTGAATNARGGAPFGFSGIANSPADTLYGITDTEFIYSINPGNGAGTFETFVNAPFGEGDIDFDPITGTLYAVGFNGNALYTVNPTTGSYTNVGLMVGVLDPSGMAFDDAGVLYMIDSATDKLHTIDKSNGNVLTTVSLNVASLSVSLGEMIGMDFDPVTKQLFVADGGAGSTDMLYTVDVTSGSLTSIGTTRTGGLSGLEFVIPEPGTLTLAGLGFMGVMVRRRRR